MVKIFGQLAQNLQSRQKEDSFQDEMERGWKLIPRAWHCAQEYGMGAAPGHLILTNEINILALYKRTSADRLTYQMFTEAEKKVLREFEGVLPERSLGLVFVSFRDEAKGIDDCFCARFSRLLEYMQSTQKLYLTRDEFIRDFEYCLWLPLVPDAAERTYNLQEILTCYRAL